MRRRERYRPFQERKSRKLSPHYTERNESPPHFMQRSDSSTYYSNRSKSSLYLERSKSPPHSMQRRGSPIHYSGRSNHPSHYLERNVSPSHYLERSKSPSYFLQRSKSPYNFSERSKSPSRNSERSNSPSHKYETNNSPSQYLEGSKSPSYYLERRESPTCYFEQRGSSFHNPERMGSPHDYSRSESPHYLKRSESPHYFSRSKSPHYFRRSKSSSPSPEVRCKSPPCYSDGGEFSARYSEPKEHAYHYPNVEQHDNNDERHYGISWSTSQDEMMCSTQFNKETPNTDIGALDSIYRHSPHTSRKNIPRRKTSKNRSHPKTYIKNNRKVKSLEEIDRMSNGEILSIRISGSANKKVRSMISQGVPRLEAKRIIMKENFVRNWNKELRQKSMTTTTLQHHGSESMSHESAESCSQFTNEEVNKEMGEFSGADHHSLPSQKTHVPEQSISKRPISEDGTSQSSENKRLKREENTEKVAVVHSGYPRAYMGFKKLNLLQNAIMSAYESLPSDGPQVRFKKCQCKSGFLLVTCADKQSADWLKNIVPQLKPWEGVALQALSEKPVECLVFVPDENGERLSEERILNRLRIGNKGLNSHLWTVIGKVPVETGQLWTFTMDVESLEVLKMLKMKLYFGFRSLKFRLQSIHAQKV